MSWLRFGRLGSILARNALKSVSVWPIFSPRPLNAVAIAPSVSLSLAGSILSSSCDELLEDRVDLDGDVLALNHLARAQFLLRRVRRRDELHELGAEHRRRRDVDVDVGRNEMQLRGIHRQVERGRAVGLRLDRGHLADLDAAHLHLGVGVHHQAGAIRDHRHRNGVGEAAPEQADGQRDDRDDRDHGRQTRQRRAPCFGFIGSPLSRQVEVAVGTVNGQRDQQGHRDDHDQRGAHRVADRDTRHRRVRRWRSSRSRCGSTGS